MEERDLLELFRQEGRERESFDLIVDKYSERLYWHIRHIIANHHDTNDILQNTFIKAWRALPSFRGDSSLFTWLYRIATNETLTFIRRERTRTFFSLSDYSQLVESKLEADPYFNGDEAQLLLTKAILELPPKQRIVFSLRYYQEMPYQEISNILNTSVGALKASYHHAYKKVEQFLKDSI